MPKMKTNSGSKKRFTLTGTGKADERAWCRNGNRLLESTCRYVSNHKIYNIRHKAHVLSHLKQYEL